MKIVLEGSEDSCIKAEKLLCNLLNIIESGDDIDQQKIEYLIELINDDIDSKISDFSKEIICITYSGKPVKPKTLG